MREDENVDYLDLMDTLVSPSSDTTTNGIRIRVKAKIIPWDPRSGPSEALFCYQLRISNNGVANKVKLTKRKWII